MNKKTNFSYLGLFLLCMFSIPINAQTYELIWQDSFDRDGKPDPDKWNYEKGFIRNLEEQIYTKRLRNVRIKNGKLEIIARKEEFENKRYDPDIQNYRMNTPSADYTSGSINTKDKFELLYGRIEVKAKLPKGNGVWPAIWMLGANFDEIEYPKAGEIDIMEHVGKVPEEIHATVHYPGKTPSGIKSNGGERLVANPSENFHIYSLNWTPEKIEFLIDNSVYHSFEIDDAGTKDNPFRKPFYLIINLALGGNWAGPVDPTIFPQKLIIDYVRVYKPKKN